jgi:SAM-dependent methyltransferase
MRRLWLAAALLFAPQAQAQTPAFSWDDGSIPFVVTPPEIVERMLRMAEVGKDDYVIDLGSGDGRIVIEAAKRGARGLGVDIDASLVAAATRNAQRAGVADRARFEQRDLFQTDLSPASVVTLYLLPALNAKLLPKLLALKPGTRIVSHDGAIGDWPFDERLELHVPDKPVGFGASKIELWIVPAQVQGAWTSELPEHGGRWSFRIKQRYQLLDAAAGSGEGRELVVADARMRGTRISMVVNGIVGRRDWRHVFTGTVDGARITGEVRVSDGNEVKTYSWTATR